MIYAVCSCEHFSDLCLLLSSKGEPVNKEDIFVAVKTCRKFHSERGESHSHSYRMRQKSPQFPFKWRAFFFVLLFCLNGFALPLACVTVQELFLAIMTNSFTKCFHHHVWIDLIGLRLCSDVKLPTVNLLIFVTSLKVSQVQSIDQIADPF